jgi:hypothetical protein
VSSRPVRLVLDTSAMAAYASTIDVGETLGEVQESNGAFALPAACLAEAAQLLPTDVLDLLVDNEAAAVTGLAAYEWRMLAAMRSVLGRLDAAAAFAVAEAHDCDILTAEPQLYASLGDDPPKISLS